MKLNKDILIKAGVGAALAAVSVIGKSLLDGITLPDWAKGFDIRVTNNQSPSLPGTSKGYYDYLSDHESREYELKKMKIQQQHELEMAQYNNKKEIANDENGKVES